MAQIVGNRTSKQVIDEQRIVRSVYPDISYLDPDETPLVTFLNRLKGRKQGVFNPEFEWFESDYAARWATMGTSTVFSSSTSTLVTVTDGTLFIAGDLFIVPKAETSSTAPEMCRVTAVSGNTLTVVRNVGGTGVDTINPSTHLRLVGSAFEENGAFPSSKTTSPVRYYNYTQIIRTATDFSGTLMATKNYGGAERPRVHREKLVEHKEKINSTLLWGQRSYSATGGPTSNPIRTSNGLNNVISTNVTDIGGILTPKKLDNFFQQGFRYGRKKKLFLVAPKIRSAVNAWAVNFLNVRPSEERYGVKITTIETPYGDAMMVHDWMLETPSGGTNGFQGWGFLIDLDQINYKYLNGNGENRDTKIIKDAVKNGQDGKKDEILSEIGFEIKQEKYHSKMFGVTDYMS